METKITVERLRSHPWLQGMEKPLTDEQLQHICDVCNEPIKFPEVKLKIDKYGINFPL
jgi:hypothetical protein